MNSNKIISFKEIQNKKTLSRKNIAEIRILRSLATLSVIAIHFLNLPISNIETGTKWQGFFFSLKAMLVFAVPTFIFISMLMTAYHPPEASLSAFYKKKWMRIGVPYILWSGAYLLVLLIVQHYTWSEIIQPKSIFYFLIYGKSYEHLYFIPILLEFMLLAPFLLRLTKKIKSLPIALLIAFIVQSIIYFVNKIYIYPHYSMLTSTFLWYFCIGFIGLWFGQNYKQNMLYLKMHSGKLKIAFIICSVIHYVYSKLLWQQLWTSIKMNNYYYYMNLNLYFLLCIAMGLLLCEKLTEPLIKQSKTVRFLQWLSDRSFGIYLLHPILMYGLRKILIFKSGWLWSITLPVGIILVAKICGEITQNIQDLPWIRFAFGNPPPKIATTSTSNE